MSAPSKTDIMQIFKRLRSAQCNKVCFDCGAKNPTWASITYGIFICIDCSGIHRSLGVHLTFIRSTNLDTNWTWQQLRQMQLGGNARAGTFFRSHNCHTNDAQQKYNSRAASMYRDKLSQDATKAMRLYGDKLHIDAGNDEVEETKETDFFDSMSSNVSSEVSQTMPVTSTTQEKVVEQQNGAAPDVSLAVSKPAPVQPAPVKKSALLAKKPGNKKPGGLGARKGLGAQKVVKDFAEIEREAEMADNIAVPKEVVKTAEEQEASAVSMRLAYQDLEIQQKKKDQALSKMDKKKAEQMERLGMGFGGNSGFGAPQSHSLISDVGVIVQEEPNGASKASYQTSTKDNFFDDFEVVEKEDLGWGNSRSRVDDICAPSSMNNSKPAWEQDLNDNISKLSTTTTKSSNWENDFDSKPKRSPAPASIAPSSSSDAVSKFGNAKSISSDMFFGGESNSERDANLSRFQGSNSISSDMYFNRDTGAGSGAMRQSQSYGAGFQAPDMDDVKESVRQGVTKVAGRLSGMASGVMSSIQRIKHEN